MYTYSLLTKAISVFLACEGSFDGAIFGKFNL